MQGRAVILMLLAASAAFGQEPEPAETEVQPSVQMSVIELAPVRLTPLQLETRIVEQFNRLARLNARIKYGSRPENFLWVQLREIRDVAETDPDRAETMLNELIERFKRWGVDLERK